MLDREQLCGQGFVRTSKIGKESLILVVEDDDDIREPLTVALGDEGYEVCEATDGRDALTKLAAMAPRAPSMILLDMMMPEMDGSQMLAELGPERVRALRIVVLSAQPQSIQRLGVLRVLRKPIALDRLLEAVHDVTDRVASSP